MSEQRKYYALCPNNCKFETMTKEQIIAAIEQAANTGTIQDIDSGFITKIKEKNKNSELSFWVGTSAEYNALDPKPEDCFCILTDDTTGVDIEAALEEMHATAENIAELNAKLREDVAAEVEKRINWNILADENASGQNEPTIQLSAPLTDFTEVVIYANIGTGASSAYKNTPLVYVGEEAEKQIGNFEETVANSGEFHAFKTPIVKLTNTETLIGEQIISSSVNTAKIKVGTTFYSNARIIVVAR